jgi:putative oxidoreductase
MTTPRSKALNISLWTAQGLLAVMFGMIGAMKTFSPIDELAAAGMTWAADVPALARFIGLSELLGGIGLIHGAGVDHGAGRYFPPLSP